MVHSRGINCPVASQNGAMPPLLSMTGIGVAPNSVPAAQPHQGGYMGRRRTTRWGCAAGTISLLPVTLASDSYSDGSSPPNRVPVCHHRLLHGCFAANIRACFSWPQHGRFVWSVLLPTRCAQGNHPGALLDSACAQRAHLVVAAAGRNCNLLSQPQLLRHLWPQVPHNLRAALLVSGK